MKLPVPMSNNLICKKVKASEFISGSSTLLATETHKKLTEWYAKVLAVGPGRVSPEGVLIPMNSQVGDTIVWEKSSGEFDFEGEQLMIVSEHNITCRLKRDDE